MLLDLFLHLSPLQANTHPSTDLARCCWISSSAVQFSGGHSTHYRPRPMLLDSIFGCPVFRRSPIHVPIRPGAAGLHLRLSRFQRSPIPLPTESSAALHFSSIVYSSGGDPSKSRPGPVLLDFVFGCPVFRQSPIPLPIELGAALPFSSIVSSSGGHPSKCRPGTVLLDFILGCLVFRRSPIPLPTEPGVIVCIGCNPSKSRPGPDLLTSSSAVPFSCGHPSYCRPSAVLLNFIFGCLVFWRSPIQLPTETGAV